MLDAVPKQLYIGGEWRDGTGGATFAVEDPATGEEIARVADATRRTRSTRSAPPTTPGAATWRDSAPRERSDILRRAYEAIVARTDELALLMTLEMGKPLAESQGRGRLRRELPALVRRGGRARRRALRDARGRRRGRLLTMKQPVGPCVFITPWNFPLAMGTRKIGPAIAAGCTMVVKPAKLTPLSMLMLARILEQAGLPAGVLNVVTASSAAR